MDTDMIKHRLEEMSVGPMHVDDASTVGENARNIRDLAQIALCHNERVTRLEEDLDKADLIWRAKKQENPND